jgi:hypothetical protein
MKNASILAVAVACGAVTLGMSREAHALGPVDLEIGAKAGMATNPWSNANYNPLGFGLGLRGGIDFLGVYAGAQFLYYFGGSEGAGTAVQSGSVSTHTWIYGLEVGYSIDLGSVLTIRPQIGLGNATFSTSTSVSGIFSGTVRQGDDSNFYLEPGAVALIHLGTYFVGADANILVFPGLDNSQASFSLHGQIGIKL